MLGFVDILHHSIFTATLLQMETKVNNFIHSSYLKIMFEFLICARLFRAGDKMAGKIGLGF